MTPYVINRNDFRSPHSDYYGFAKGDTVWVRDINDVDDDGEVIIWRDPWDARDPQPLGRESSWALPSALTPLCVLPEDADVNAVVAFLTSDVPVAL